MINVRHLNKISNKKKILNDISLNIYPGEVTALVGDLDSGNIELLKSLDQATSDNKGHVWLDGEDIRYLNKYEKADFQSHVGVISTQNNLNPKHSLIENLLHDKWYKNLSLRDVLWVYPEGQKKLSIQLLAKVNLKSHFNESVSDLNTRRIERFKLAKVLYDQPSLVLCYEPVFDEAPATTFLIMDTLKTYASKQNASVVIASTNSEVMRQYADHLIVMRNGRVIADESTKHADSRIFSVNHDRPVANA